MADLAAEPPTSRLTSMAEVDSSPTAALPAKTLMADLVADLPTSTTLTLMMGVDSSLSTKQYQVGQRLHSSLSAISSAISMGF